MRLLVLGGAGYIGSHTAVELLESGHEVVIVDSLVTGYRAAVSAVEIPRRAGDPARLVASGEKAKEILGRKPEITELEDIIRSAWAWHSSHPNGYDKI